MTDSKPQAYSLVGVPVSIDWNLDITPGLEITTKGGPGSGNFGHEGRPGLVGGSSPDKGSDPGSTGEQHFKDVKVNTRNGATSVKASEFGGMLYHATTIGRLKGMVDAGNSLEPRVGDWVKEAYGEYMGEDYNNSEGESFVPEAVYFVGPEHDDPRQQNIDFVRTLVGRKLGKDRDEVTLEDIRKHGLVVAVRPEDIEGDHELYRVSDDDQYLEHLKVVDAFPEKDEEDTGEPKEPKVPESAYVGSLFNLEPFTKSRYALTSDYRHRNEYIGPETGDYISRESIPASQYLFGDQLAEYVRVMSKDPVKEKSKRPAVHLLRVFVNPKQKSEKGGPGSGNYGHAGRPGEVGGSMARSQGMSVATGKTAFERQAMRAANAATEVFRKDPAFIKAGKTIQYALNRRNNLKNEADSISGLSKEASDRYDAIYSKKVMGYMDHLKELSITRYAIDKNYYFAVEEKNEADIAKYGKEMEAEAKEREEVVSQWKVAKLEMQQALEETNRLARQKTEKLAEAERVLDDPAVAKAIQTRLDFGVKMGEAVRTKMLSAVENVQGELDQAHVLGDQVDAEVSKALVDSNGDESAVSQDILDRYVIAESKVVAAYQRMGRTATGYTYHENPLDSFATEIQDLDAPFTSSDFLNEVKKGKEAAEKMLPAGAFEDKKIVARGRSVGRGDCDGKIANIYGNDKADTVVHELGHMLEDNNPVVKKLAVDFRERRTAGEKLQPLQALLPNSGYGVFEGAKPDKFFSPYCGKVYSEGETEIVSMGMQEMYSFPVRFAKADPEYFNFIYAVLRV